uniref:Alcohol dehydrogenase-like C-terminal domain-containing protein n=1 Tax=Aegilops tauschii subsp. strangulata TaxID=200361 RepID=A0A453IZ47_AEGTS
MLSTRVAGKKFGVTDFVNPSKLGESPLSQVIIEMTGGGADYCFECIGVASVMTEAFRSAKQGNGKTVILGLEKDGKPISLPSIEFLFGKCVMGSLFGGIKPKTDIPILAKKCMSKELELEKLITHEVGLQEINTAFDLLLQGKSLRCIIWMDKLAA